ASSRKSPRKWPNCGAVFTRLVLRTTVAHTRKARKSAGATVCAPSTASSNTACAGEGRPLFLCRRLRRHGRLRTVRLAHARRRCALVLGRGGRIHRGDARELRALGQACLHERRAFLAGGRDSTRIRGERDRACRQPGGPLGAYRGRGLEQL